MYTFTLQKVLDYRKNNEERAQQRLASALKETEAARDNLQRTEEALSQCQLEYTGIQSMRVNLAQVILTSEYATHLENRVRFQKQELACKEDLLHEERRLTEKAMQDRKIMDTLRDKDLSNYNKLADQAEQRQNDELAQRVFLRKL